MNNADILEYLRIVEMKLAALIQDIKNIKEQLEKQPRQRRNAITSSSAAASASANSGVNSGATFFTALTADDPPRELTKYEQCPHN